MWKEKVSVTPPYHFDRVLDRLSLDPLNAVDREAREVRVPIRNQAGDVCIVKVQALDYAGEHEFLVSGETDQGEMMKEIKRIFQWENHLRDVLDHFSKTSLSAIFEEHAGTPLVLDYSVYNCMMKCIIHQRLNLSFAYTLTERFVHAFGEQKDGVWCYPKPETIAELDYQDLRDLQFSMRKAEYTIDTSRMIADMLAMSKEWEPYLSYASLYLWRSIE
nr:hypothetical protein P5630_00460 [Bacillus subtilis]